MLSPNGGPYLVGCHKFVSFFVTLLYIRTRFSIIAVNNPNFYLLGLLSELLRTLKAFKAFQDVSERRMRVRGLPHLECFI